MKNNIFSKSFVLTLIAILCFQAAIPCSMYKITINGKTIVGNNEDSWGRDARIWFEQRVNGKFGFVCVGYARKSHPDGAMNEYGLAFDAFTMPRKANIPEKDPNKNDFAYSHIRTIMQQCKTVDEVYAFLEKLNLHILNGSLLFNGGMFLFVDKTGKYLVVEADKLTFGKDDKFVLANFSFADTKDLSAIKMERYCKGVAFLNNKKLNTNLSFFEALSDTMSVNRAKAGDGTLYTNIYDLNEGLIHLYFFHDFSKRVTFNLKEELAKGDHSYNFTELFPNNKKYQKFIQYKTPQNSRVIFGFLIFCLILFFISFVYFTASFVRNLKSKNNLKPSFENTKLGLSLLCLALSYYSFVLTNNQAIFYFPSPYNDGGFSLINILSYLPFLLLIFTIPLLKTNLKIFKLDAWTNLEKYLFVINNFVFVALIGFFAYWGMFNVFN